MNLRVLSKNSTSLIRPFGGENSLLPHILNGASTCLPIVMGYVPIGFAFGVLAAHNELPAFFAIGLSVFTYAGSSQFLALGLIAQGASVASIAFATFIINARYLLMSMAMVKYLKAWPTLERLLFGFEMTDETFVLHSTRLSKSDESKIHIFSTNIAAHLSWIFGSTLGYFANTFLPDPSTIGLNFALAAMFIALLAPQLRDLGRISAALLSVGIYILMQLTPLKDLAVIIAPTVGAVFMGMEELWAIKH